MIRKEGLILDTIKTYSCPCCGASLAYDGSSQSLHCASCGNDYTPETLQQIFDADARSNEKSTYDWSKYEPRAFGEVESEGLRTYSCPACAAEITGSAAMGATICPYCGNAAIVEKQFEGAYAPDYLVPFRVDKKAAMKHFEQTCQKLPFLPDEFKNKRKVEEMSGIYVPFWMFDCKADADITYRGERVSHWSDSENDYVKTDYYKIFRAGTLDFENLPVDASQKADDAYMDALEPYNLNDAVKFEPAYLAGYLADKYDVSAAESEQRANSRIKNTTESTFAETVTGFTGVVTEKSRVAFTQGKVRYSLLPVWMLHIAYEGKNYAYAVNGQTGKVVGSFPISKKKRNLFFLKAFGIGVAIMAALAVLFTLL